MMNRTANCDDNHNQASSSAVPVDTETPINSSKPLSALVSSERTKASRHGDKYQHGLGLVIMLRAFRMYQEDRDFDFVIAMEDSAGKDFDDIMCIYRSPRLPSGTVRVQAKHKRPEQYKKSILTQNVLFPSSHSFDGAYSIPQYFVSFLQVDQKRQTTTGTYVLCTNALLDERLEDCLMVKRNHVDDWLQFYHDIEATCYQINHKKTDKNKFRASCVLELGKLMAQHVFNGTVIVFEDILYCEFSTLIKRCVQSSVPSKNSNECSSNYKFNESFFEDPTSSEIGMFRKGFNKEYKRLFKDDRLDVVILKIDSKSFNYALSQRGNFDRYLQKFCESFVLVCNSLNADELDGKAVELLPKWCNPAAVIDTLHTLFTDAMESETPIPIELRDIKEMFITKAANKNFAQLESSSKDYFESLLHKYSHIEIDSKRLKRSAFAAFLEDVAADGVYEFKSRLDINVNAHIVAQTVSLFQWQTLFLDSKKFEENQDVLKILQDMLSYIRDINHPTVKAITVVGKPDPVTINAIENLSKRYNQKIVVIDKISENQATDENCERFYVNDLTQQASRQLFEGNEKRIIFGTVTPLSKIVIETDDLCFVLALLESVVQPSEINNNLNDCNYENIRHWYINRHYEPSDAAMQKANVPHMQHNRIPFPYSNHKCVSFREMANFMYNNNSTLANVQCVFDTDEEDPDPPGFHDSNSGKVFIFLNDSGHGKTCYFTWLAWRLAKHDRGLYVVKLNAMEYSSDFKRLENIGLQNMDDTGIVRLLYRLIHLAVFVPSMLKQTNQDTKVQRDEADQCAKLLTFLDGRIVMDETMASELTAKQLIELRLFRTKFNEKQLVLILDGFDEIAPHYKDVVMDCFARFAKFERIRNIYLSSRPHDFEKDFRQNFNSCKINRLQPFSRDNVLLSLHKFLLNNIDDYKTCEKEQCKYVLTVLYHVITEILGDLITVPLLLCLAQDTVLPVIRDHINFKQCTISKHLLVSEKLDTMRLVEYFIDRKLRIFNTDKSGTTEAVVETSVAQQKEELFNKQIRKRHVLLAMCVIFDKNDRNKLLSAREQAKVTKFIETVITGGEKTGIIEGIRDGVPQFVHRIFAEYFAACWLSKNWQRFQGESVFRSQVIWARSMEKVRDFFNRLILRESEGCDLHWAVLNKSVVQVRKILYENPSAVEVNDKVGRLPLHYGHLCYIYAEVLPNHRLADLGRKTDILFQWNALDYAFVLDDGLAIEYLLKCGVGLNMEILKQQLYSNDVDIVIRQAINYAFYLEHYGKLPDAANTIRTHLVNYLINELKLDIHLPRTKLESLSILEFTAAWNLVNEFHQLVTQSGSREQALDGLVERLFQLAFERNAYDIINYLFTRCSLPLPRINDDRGLVEGAKRAIEQNNLKLFKTIFQLLCMRHENAYVAENDITDVSDIENENDMIEIQHAFINECCVLSNENVILALPEFSFLHDFNSSNVGEIFVEFLLTRAIHVGNVQMVSYILQKTKRSVTNQLIVTIMRLFPKSQPLCHKKSVPAFKYLLNKTVDLRSVDKEGRNLFHMVAQNGCFYMLPCLIAKGFDPRQINDLNNWNGFHYLVSCSDKVGLRVPKAIVFLQHMGYVDDFTTLNKTGENVFDFAITKERYEAAHMLVQALYYSLSYTAKVHAVMDILQRMLLNHTVDRALYFLFTACWNSSIRGFKSDQLWHAVYSSIIKQIPIV